MLLIIVQEKVKILDSMLICYENDYDSLYNLMDVICLIMLLKNLDPS